MIGILNQLVIASLVLLAASSSSSNGGTSTSTDTIHATSGTTFTSLTSPSQTVTISTDTHSSSNTDTTIPTIPPTLSTSTSTKTTCTSDPNDRCTCLPGTAGSHCGGHAGLAGNCNKDTLYTCKLRDKPRGVAGKYCKNIWCDGKCASDPNLAGGDRCYDT